MTKPAFNLGLLTAGSGLWLAAVLFALTQLSRFDAAAGAAGHPPAQWCSAVKDKNGPKTVPVTLNGSKPTLILLIHPQCPCSRATLSELNHLVALCPNRAAITVLFLRPAGYPDSWAKTDLWRQAAAIPGISVRLDNGGAVARRFGAETSGEALLYDPQGRLLYHGGLTGSRGHEGENAGLSAVAALLSDETRLEKTDMADKFETARQPVYGCPLMAKRGDQP